MHKLHSKKENVKKKQKMSGISVGGALRCHAQAVACRGSEIKRPIMVSKETYYSVKRERPIIVSRDLLAQAAAFSEMSGF